MKEHDYNTNEQAGSTDLEGRLRTYYGPQLREQPLAQASWQNLRRQLGAQERPRQRYRFHRLFARRRTRANVPIAIRHTFARIVSEARIPARHTQLRCSLEPRRREPAVRLSWPGRRGIRLLLSLQALTTMGQAEMDVLLATGLARSVGARQPRYRLGQFLLAGLLMLACAALILFWLHHLPLVGLPVALVLCAGAAFLWHIQARSLAFYADRLIVRWLGRSRACSGLHALADSSRTPGRRRWGEPSLEERIERVCGSGVETRSNQLTLVG
jgi:hypothetical protein